MHNLQKRLVKTPQLSLANDAVKFLQNVVVSENIDDQSTKGLIDKLDRAKQALAEALGTSSPNDLLQKYNKCQELVGYAADILKGHRSESVEAWLNYYNAN